MSNINSVVIDGNLVADPRVVGEGDKSRTVFTIAHNERKLDGSDGNTVFVDVTAFRNLGKNAATTLKKGMSVVIGGRLNSYSTKAVIDGEEKNIGRLSVTASTLGPELTFASAQVTKNKKPSGNGGGGSAASSPASASASAPRADDDF